MPQEFRIPGPGPAAGAEWPGSYDAVFPDHKLTVAGLLNFARAQHPDSLAVATPAARVSYAEIDERSRRLAATLVEHGVGKGTIVGILLPNGIEWVIAWAAVTRIGAIAAPVNTFYAAPELATMLRHADVRVLITCPFFGAHDYLERLTQITPELSSATAPRRLMLRSLPQLRHVLVWGGDAPAWATAIDESTEPDQDVLTVVAGMEDDVTPADPMLLTYTSGSTGEPKGVVHGNGPLLRHGRNLAAMSGIGPDDRIWTPMPLCWVGGFSFTLLRAMSVGAAFVTQDRMDVEVALQLLERERVTCVSAWPALGAQLAAHPDFPSVDLSALRLGTFYQGRSPQSRPADPGLSVTSLGMSETAGPHTFWTEEEDRAGSPEEFRGSFGHQMPGVSHRIVDADGKDLPEGTEGEVLVRGYSLMLGLYKHEHGEVFDADGWYHTGDRGYFDRGWFFFTGRNSDLIKTKGANVSPSEVEAALCDIPGVQQAFVFGVEHEEYGQEVVALVIPSPSADPAPDAESLTPQLRQRLSSYKVPRKIFLLASDEVPYLSSQKADRRALADVAARCCADAAGTPRQPTSH
jgi:acyl-CoA synthetase (AMP-forming)/AMP-acid ligase II